MTAIVDIIKSRSGDKTRWKVWCVDCGVLETPQRLYEPEDPRLIEVRDRHRKWHEEIES